MKSIGPEMRGGRGKSKSVRHAGQNHKNAQSESGHVTVLQFVFFKDMARIRDVAKDVHHGVVGSQQLLVVA